MNISLQPRLIFLVCASFWLPCLPAETVQIEEWEVPWPESRPRDPYVDSQGRVWFCGQAGSYIAYFNPANGEFRKYDLGNYEGPHNLG